MTPADHDPIQDRPLSRRQVLGAGVGVAAAAVLAACSRDGDTPDIAAGGQASTTSTRSGAPTTTAPTQTTATTQPPAAAVTAATLAPTPECVDADDVTLAQTEGPYFTRSSPEKANLYADVNTGTRLVLTGSVLTTSCLAVSRALVDVWQADAAGDYDNRGYRLRGHLFTDASGRYRIETVVPGLYPGRTRHLHVKVQAPNGPILTTQLYFPGEARNASDGIYRRELEMDISDTANGKNGTFDFVVRG
ncbi:MAG: dioxygenase [Acidimicrobiales bacterium]